MPRATAVFQPTFRGEGDHPLRRHPGRSALRPERAPPRHAGGPPAGAELPRGAGGVALGRGARRAVLRPSRSRAGSPRGTRRSSPASPGQAATAIDNARLCSRRRSASSTSGAGPRRRCKALNETLEQRVADAIAERLAGRGRAAPGAEDGGDRQADRRRRARLQQPAAGDLRQPAAPRPRRRRQRARRRAGSATRSPASARARKLASQLLAFGRRQPLEPKVVNVGASRLRHGRAAAPDDRRGHRGRDAWSPAGSGTAWSTRPSSRPRS